MKSPPLTKRQSEMAGLVAQGLCNKGIARQLDVTESCVKQTLQRAFEKLGFHNRTQLALWASVRIGLPDHDPYDR